MALSATIYNFDITLADVDRNVYEELALRVACHPSESPEYLVARVLAYCLEYTEGIAFGRGISEPDDPPIAVRDLTGALKAWIEIGSPDAARLHKASKATPRVAVYTHKDPRILLRQLEGERIHKSEALEIYAFDRELIDGLVELIDRRITLGLSITDRQVYATVGDTTVTGTIERHALPGA
ncbi:MAG: YaeQ family protein [Gemmatimonadota bacterium]